MSIKTVKEFIEKMDIEGGVGEMMIYHGHITDPDFEDEQFRREWNKLCSQFEIVEELVQELDDRLAEEEDE